MKDLEPKARYMSYGKEGERSARPEDGEGVIRSESRQHGRSRASKKRAKRKQKNNHHNSSVDASHGAPTTAAATDRPTENPSVKPRGSRGHFPEGSSESDVNYEDIDVFEEESSKKVQFKTAHRRPTRRANDAEEDKDDGEYPRAHDSRTTSSAGKITLPSPSVTRISQLLPVSSSTTSSLDLDTASTTMTTEQRANCLLNFLLQPSGVTTDAFYAKYWEKKPLLVQCPDGSDNESAAMSSHRNRLVGLMSLAEIQALTRRQATTLTSRERDDDPSIYYGRDVNVTKYEKSEGGSYRRRTLDPFPPASGKEDVDDNDDPDRKYVRVDPGELWDRYYESMGCTIRFLCPHKYFSPVHALLSALEDEFGAMVGANAYLTPPRGAQGFAPHYDDIEAFVCQLEGRKRWKVYAPISPSERLPRTSSRDYDPSELVNSASPNPVLDVVLSPGDVLYMPRGWIHHACTLPKSSTSSSADGHSLHLTVSTMQNWAWADLLENVLTDALESAAGSASTILMREGLPRSFLSYMGVAHDSAEETMPDSLRRKRPRHEQPHDDEEEDAVEATRVSQIERLREEFRRETKRRIARVAQEAMNLLDATCDQMAKRFLSDRLPPASLERGGDDDTILRPDTLCRLARPGIARLVLEDGKAVLYHCCDNSLAFHGRPLSPLEFEMDDAPALEQLLTTSEPRWIAVQDLFHDSMDDKLAVAQALYDEGILAVRSSS